MGPPGLVTASFAGMRETIPALREEAEKHDFTIPVIIGGGMSDIQIRQYVSADYWMPDAMAGGSKHGENGK